MKWYNNKMNTVTSYVIKGNKQLSGAVHLSGSKNIALKVIVASLLFEGDVFLNNIPKIDDVLNLIVLINDLGAYAQFVTPNTLKINSAGLYKNEVSMLHSSKIRASFLLFAPLLHRFGGANIPNPGGCRIGARPIDRILDGLSALGVNAFYDPETGLNKVSITELKDSNYKFEKPSVTGTELLIMFACFGESRETIIENSVLEPEVDELIDFLNQGGAKIKRDGNDIKIQSVTKLVQNSEFKIASDRIEFMTFAALSVVTKSDLIINGVDFNAFSPFVKDLVQVGIQVKKLTQNSCQIIGPDHLLPSKMITGTYPNFSTDAMPLWAIMMTQAQGSSTICETMFEGRFSFISELTKMGAKIEFIENPTSIEEKFQFNIEKNKKYEQTIQINGPITLHNGVVSAHDLRAGASLVVASLAASGESIILDAQNIERGYENFIDKLVSIGADIKRS